MVEVLKQGQFRPFAVEEQVVSLYAVTNGFMDDTPVSEIARFEADLTAHMRAGTGTCCAGSPRPGPSPTRTPSTAP